MIKIGNATKLIPLLKEFVHTHPDLTEFLMDETDKEQVGDEIEITFRSKDEVNSKKMVVTKSDLELFDVVKSFVR